MCGIAGVFNLKSTENQSAAVETMLSQLEHRGPDAKGFWHEGPITLGHRRLKILDLSDRGNQPIISHCQRYVISFNGEIYNFKEIQDELELTDEQLQTSTDTEILVEAWSRWGADTLSKLVGQWAFAVYDRKEETLWLTRDRFGEKPLFYYARNGRVAFASSLGALLTYHEVPKELDPQSMEEFVTMRYVISPRTVVKDTFKLPGGHWLKADKNGIATKPWYDLQFTSNDTYNKASKEDLVDEFDQLFKQAVNRCLVSDVPVALLLSDGIDSNAIASTISSMGKKLPCITYEASADTSALNPGHDTETEGNLTRLLLKVSSKERVERMPEAFGDFCEPVGDGASLATWFLLHNAKKMATVFLCGHGADELIGGYRLSQERFRLQTLRKFAWLPQSLMQKPLDRFLFGAEPLDNRREAFRRANATTAPSAARYLIHRPLPTTDIHQIFLRPALATGATGYLSSIDKLYDSSLNPQSDLDSMQKVMIHTFLSENILSFADSVAMSSSTELRMPYLDRDLVKFLVQLPRHCRVSRWPGRSNTKQILRWWGETNMDQAIVKRRKSTFPFGSLRPLMNEHSDTLKSYIMDSPAVREALPGIEGWLGHPTQYYRGCFQGTLWALLSLGIWCQKNRL